MNDQAQLTLGVAFVDESALWSWEIRDDASNQVVEGSWPNHWMAYTTREDACAAGVTRLSELEGRGDEARITECLEACELEHTKREVLGSAG